ncbi:unnamed protein product [Schistosoma turkestanicum]|nr:unnamed protein product [Schistosoma turkestanicum]
MYSFHSAVRQTSSDVCLFTAITSTILKNIKCNFANDKLYSPCNSASHVTGINMFYLNLKFTRYITFHFLSFPYIHSTECFSASNPTLVFRDLFKTSFSHQLHYIKKFFRNDHCNKYFCQLWFTCIWNFSCIIGLFLCRLTKFQLFNVL